MKLKLKFKISMKGVRKVSKMFVKMGTKKLKHHNNDAVRNAAKYLAGIMKSNAPVKYGALKKSIGYKMLRGKNAGGFAIAYVGVRKGLKSVKKMNRKGNAMPNLYLHLVIKGTKPHSLGYSKGKLTYPPYKYVTHPGARANDFMRRAKMQARAGVQARLKGGFRKALALHKVA
jgi:HK97 gp10 family phage protein